MASCRHCTPLQRRASKQATRAAKKAASGKHCPPGGCAKVPAKKVAAKKQPAKKQPPCCLK